MADTQPSLGRQTVRGVAWAAAANVSTRFISLLGLTLLARLLTPQDFGVVAFALVVMTYVETLGDLGTGMALVYWRSRERDAAQITFLFNLVLGALWFTLTYATAPQVAAFFHSAEGTSILRALAWSFIIKGLGNTHDALCRKQLRFKARLLPEAGLAVLKAVVAVLLARAGLGAWSLVWGQLAGLTVWTLLLWLVVPWRPTRGLPLDLVRPMLAYGRGIVAVNVLAAVVHHVDLVVVGRVLGAAALGFYQMAYKIPEMAITTIVWVTGRVLFPAFSKLQQDSERMAAAYLEALKFIALVTLPLATSLVLLAEPLVITLFGSQWLASVPILQVLAVYACLRSLGSHAGDVLKATGRTGLLAALGVLKAALLVPCLLLASRHGALAVAGAMALVTLGTVLLNLTVVSRLLPRLTAAAIARALWPGAAVAALMAAVLLAWCRLPLEGPAELAGAAAVGSLSYLLALRRAFPETWDKARGLLLARTGPHASTSQAVSE